LTRGRIPDGRGRSNSETVLGVLEDVRSTFRGRSHSQTDISALLSLYGSITSLCARSKRIIAILNSQDQSLPKSVIHLNGLTPADTEQFSRFFEELLDFGRYLNAVSFAAIDIYFPGLRNDLLAAIGRDMEFSHLYTKSIAPKYKLGHEALPPTLVQILDRFNGDWGPENVGGHLMLEFRMAGDDQKPDGIFYNHRDIPRAVLTDNLVKVAELLESCRGQIREIVKENWDFRDLVDTGCSPILVEGGIHMAKTEYNVSNSQAGAIGPNAHSHDTTFQQRLEQESNSLDLKVLSAQLEQLQAELAKHATERDHYAAIVAVSDAAASAREGKGGESLSKLKAAGKWALKIASEIGTTVAADAIKQSLGMSS
jgi:hypothetical protein